MKPDKTIRIGLIGTGIIGSAVAEGFCSCEEADLHLWISPRTKAKAEALRARYPERITVAQTNQEIADAADWIILAVLPAQAAEVLAAIHFTPDQKLISLVSKLDREEALQLTGPLAVFEDVVPLPFAARRLGPSVIYPPSPETEELLSLISDVVPVRTAQEMAVLRTVTAVMSSYYMLLADITEWCCREGMEEPAARAYTTDFFGTLSRMAADYPGPLRELALEMTPGGLNWQALNELQEDGSLAAWTDTLAHILTRVRGD